MTDRLAAFLVGFACALGPLSARADGPSPAPPSIPTAAASPAASSASAPSPTAAPPAAAPASTKPAAPAAPAGNATLAGLATPLPSTVFRFSGTYELDVFGVASGGVRRGARVLDDLLLNADVDLAAGLGWKGASGHISFLNNFGGQPNTLAGTLQGIDNIEVTSPRPKIYEAWVDQALGGGGSDLRVGLYDADVEFNVTDSAALFLQPTYGTSSEFAATGPNGPSIFPSTALAARLNLQPRQDVYVHLAVIDAQAGTLGDPGGVDTHFAKGLLLIAESGWTGSGKVAVGIWTYTRRQPDVDAPPPPAVAPRSYSRGIYLMVDEPFIRTAWGAQASVFVRGGLSDGETTPYRTAGSMGVLLSHVIPVRPDSALGVGFAWGGLSAKYRADSEATGTPLAEAETALEVTYADKVGQYLTFQPDLQFIHRPSGNPMIRDALVLGLRTSTSF